MEERVTRTNRVREIEFMKALAIIGMIFVHVFEMSDIETVTGSERAAVFLIEFFGCLLSAGVFMFAMGWGIAYSKSRTAMSYVRRSLNLFLLGLAVNLFQQYLPAVFVPDFYGPLSEVLPAILATDIYFYAALVCLFFAFIKKLENRRMLALSISVLTVVISFSINILVGFESFTTGNEWLDTVLGLFIRVNEYSYFPFISWCIFPILGYWLVVCFRNTTMKKAVIFAGATGIASIVVGEWLIRMNGMMDAAIFDVVEIPEGQFYALHPYYALVGFGLIALEFVVIHVILLASRQRIPQFLLTMSRNVTPIYVVQWLVIGLISPLLANMTNIWLNMLAALAVLFIAYHGGALLKKRNLIRV